MQGLSDLSQAPTPSPKRDRRPSAVPAQSPTLSVNDRLFLNEYFSNGRNGTQAYMKVHPKAKYTSAESSACDLLRKPKIVVEIQRRLQYEQGITKKNLETDLLWCAEKAKAASDYDALASITMDCAKLAGFLVEKREDITKGPALTDTQRTTRLIALMAEMKILPQREITEVTIPT